MDLRSMLAVVVTAVIAAIGLPAGAAAGDQILLGGGAAIVLHDDTLCTLTAMGHDSDGRLIGFTSAHCGGPGSEVVAEGAEERGTVGTVVAADDAVGYAVIEFDPVKVKPIADYEGFGIFGIGPPEPEPVNPEPAGPEPAAPEAASPAPAAPEPAAAKQACKLGQGTGLNCYDIGSDGVNTTAQEWWQPGDDGSPITIDNLIVGMVRDGSTPVAPPDQSGPGIVMFKEVLADVNAKGGPGAGFGLG
ncbi:serine protease [Mycolicibacter sinensis]|nr:serine protease [Mycolicibacter sinensis]